jgi:hypothetical protein
MLTTEGTTFWTSCVYSSSIAARPGNRVLEAPVGNEEGRPGDSRQRCQAKVARIASATIGSDFLSIRKY